MALEIGTRFGPYEVLAPAGAGGMGEVYRARDTRLDRIVALKVLPSHLAANAALRERFEREARAISQLNHPNICTLHDVGSADGVGFLVMEFLDGETLMQRLGRGPLALGPALQIAIQIAEALDRAHRAGIVHRDLKPSNVFLVRSASASSPPLVKLLDFGLAKSTAPMTPGLPASPTVGVLTGEGTILGTLQYMAPEQLEGKETDHRVDVFAFGAVLHEMLTGTPAFRGASQASLIASILTSEPTSGIVASAGHASGPRSSGVAAVSPRIRMSAGRRCTTCCCSFAGLRRSRWRPQRLSRAAPLAAARATLVDGGDCEPELDWPRDRRGLAAGATHPDAASRDSIRNFRRRHGTTFQVAGLGIIDMTPALSHDGSAHHHSRDWNRWRPASVAAAARLSGDRTAVRHGQWVPAVLVCLTIGR